MSEMVDRAAEAAKRVLNGNAPDDFKGVLTDETLQEIARAVVAAVREPTLAMHNAGNAEMVKDGAYIDVTEIFRAMIDEALKDVGASTSRRPAASASCLGNGSGS